MSLEKRVQVLSMLCEGSSMQSIARVTNVSFKTILKLLKDEDVVTIAGQSSSSLDLGANFTWALYKKGIDYISTMLKGAAEWMEEKEYASVEQLKGSMSHENCPNPAAFERGNYMKALTSYTKG